MGEVCLLADQTNALTYKYKCARPYRLALPWGRDLLIEQFMNCLNYDPFRLANNGDFALYEVRG